MITQRKAHLVTEDVELLSDAQLLEPFSHSVQHNNKMHSSACIS